MVIGRICRLAETADLTEWVDERLAVQTDRALLSQECEASQPAVDPDTPREIVGKRLVLTEVELLTRRCYDTQ